MRGGVVLLSLGLATRGVDAQVDVVDVRSVPGVEGTYPSWSPDGQRLAFERGGDLYTVRLDGSMERPLVVHPSLDETPVWTLGDGILFASDRAGELDVYVVAPDGSGLRRLTDDPSDDDHPRASATGSAIVFNSKRHDGESYQIWSMNADGTDVGRLTVHDEWDTYPSLSADGHRLLWRRVLPEEGRRNSEVFVMSLRDAVPTNLTADPAFDGYPVWSPNERWIAFASDRDSEGLDQLFVMRDDGSEVTRLSSLEPGVQHARPSWSFDGARLAATREQDGTTTLVVFTLEGPGIGGR